MLSESVKKGLIGIVGGANASMSKEERLCYAYDATNSPCLPEAVLFPSSAEEISLIMKMASSERFPVVPRGAGSGFSGGSVPVEGGVVVSLERMRRVIEIDEENFTALVEPGVITWELQEEVERRGLFYPPDPTSLKFSTIGGNIAECAGGPRAVKYGVTKDYVMALEAVLPSGEIINTGVKTVKGVVGYDLTRLLVGSEGTLAIITKALLRLIPLPESVKTMLAVFPPDLKGASRAVSAIIRAKVVPTTLEMMDKVSLKCAEDYAEIGLPADSSALLIEMDGPPETVEREAARVKAICMECGARSVEIAADHKAAKNLWKARRAISASLYRVKPHKINEDIVVPRSKIPELADGITAISQRRGMLIACFGHAGDGNIHVNFMHDRANPAEAASALEAVEEVFNLVIGLGGTISGEHGVGNTKSKYITMELKPEVIELSKRIKAAFDPLGILNPGKIFPSAAAERVGVRGL